MGDLTHGLQGLPLLSHCAIGNRREASAGKLLIKPAPRSLGPM
ncbi:MAG TPA: hypothetical protein VF900_05515 [Candidatus Acidoferrum sp.]